MYRFTNDYSEGAHPRILDAMVRTNLEGNFGYSTDPHSKHAHELIRAAIGRPDADVHILVGGTQTNATCLCAFLRPHEAAIAASTGHICVHETGAIEATGHKCIAMPAAPGGKLTPDAVRAAVAAHPDEHMVKPKLVYVSNTTEVGGVYTTAELEALRAVCDELGLYLYLDGARLSSALAAGGASLTDLGRLCDAFYIGGTKNGAMFGEALVITRPELTDGFFRMKKRMGAVMEKGWIQGVMFQALFTDDLYFHMARHANEMAARLQNGLRAKGWTLWVDSPTNQVFAVVDNALKPQLDAVCDYEDWCPYDGSRTVVRFVTCFQTSQEDVDGLLAALPDLH